MMKAFTLFFICLQLSFSGLCQDTLLVTRDTVIGGKAFKQEDIKDWLHRRGLGTSSNPEKQSFLLIIPILASNPTAGFIFGAGLTYAFKTKGSERMSTASSNATYSTNGLLNLNVKSNLFTSKDKLVLNGDWRFLYNTETTYGLGSKDYGSKNFNLLGYEVSTDTLGQMLKYYQVRVHETGSWKLVKNFFAGIGFHYDHYYDIEDGALQAGDTLRSFQYQYSRRHGFNTQHYSATGFSLNFLYDSRDNQVNTYRGMYGNVNYRVNLTGLGSSQNSSLLLAEYRAFIPFDKVNYRHVLAFWLYGNFVTSGEAPYLLLPAIGYDQRQKSGRGYTFGQFRGEGMVYGESEYRFPISPNTGILGGVLFVNCTTTSAQDRKIDLFEYLRPAYGGGLRIMMDKKTRTRLQVDAGIVDRSLGFYFGAQETF